MVRESLKWRAKDGEAVEALHAAAPDLAAVYQQLQGQPDGVPGGLVGIVSSLSARVDNACK